MIRRKIATHLTTSQGSISVAVAELGPVARVEQVDRHRGRVDLGQLEGHLDPLLAAISPRLRMPPTQVSSPASLTAWIVRSRPS